MTPFPLLILIDTVTGNLRVLTKVTFDICQQMGMVQNEGGSSNFFLSTGGGCAFFYFGFGGVIQLFDGDFLYFKNTWFICFKCFVSLFFILCYSPIWTWYLPLSPLTATAGGGSLVKQTDMRFIFN